MAMMPPDIWDDHSVNRMSCSRAMRGIKSQPNWFWSETAHPPKNSVFLFDLPQECIKMLGDFKAQSEHYLSIAGPSLILHTFANSRFLCGILQACTWIIEFLAACASQLVIPGKVRIISERRRITMEYSPTFTAKIAQFCK